MTMMNKYLLFVITLALANLVQASDLLDRD